MPTDIFQSPSFITPWTIFLIALIFVVGAIIILTIIERRLNKRISQNIVNEDNIFLKKISLLRENKSRPELMLISIDALAREFFEKKYKLIKNLKYSSLSEYFKKNNDFSSVRFCEKMQEALYAGKEMNLDFVNNLLNNLDFLINSENREKNLIKNNKSMVSQNSFLSIFKKTNSQSVKLGNLNTPTYNKNLPKKVDNIIQENDPIISTTPDIKTINYENIVILTNEEERNVFRIKNYLKEGLDRGFSINLLRQKLMESKFNDKEINEAINRIRGEYANQNEIIDNSGNRYINSQNSLMNNSEKRIPNNRIIHSQNDASISFKPAATSYIKEQIKSKKVNINNEDNYSNVRSLDNYHRIKKKISQKRIITSDQDSLV